MFIKSVYRRSIPLDDAINQVLSMAEMDFKECDMVWDLFKGFPDYKYPVGNCYPKENGDVIIELAVSGCKKEEIQIELEGNVLNIKGNPKIEEEPKVFFFRNLKKKSFDVSYKLSEKLDLGKIETTLEDGILKLLIPLKEESKIVKKMLEIK